MKHVNLRLTVVTGWPLPPSADHPQPFVSKVTREHLHSPSPSFSPQLPQSTMEATGHGDPGDAAGGASPLSPTSPAQAAVVTIAVDGTEIPKEFIKDNIQVTGEDVLERCRQMSEVQRHVHYLYLSQSDLVEVHMRQRQAVEQDLRHQLATVTAERDASVRPVGEAVERVTEAYRERDVAQAQEFEARALAVTKGRQVDALTAELDSLRRELTMVTSVNETDDMERSMKQRRVTIDIDSTITHVNQLDALANTNENPEMKAMLGTKVDLVRAGLERVKKSHGTQEPAVTDKKVSEADKPPDNLGRAPIPSWLKSDVYERGRQMGASGSGASSAAPAAVTGGDGEAKSKAKPAERKRSTSQANKITRPPVDKVDLESSTPTEEPPAVPARDAPTFGGAEAVTGAADAGRQPSTPPQSTASGPQPRKRSDEEQRNLNEVLEVVNMQRAAKFVTASRETRPVGRGDRYHNPHFTAPPNARHLDQNVRYTWRFFHGQWVDQPERRVLVDPVNREVTIDELDSFEGFTRLYGDMYRLIPLKFLGGPAVWRANLPDHRKSMHEEWVKSISFLQSLLPEDYSPPMNLRCIHKDFFDSHYVPETCVYVRRLPEVQEKELLNMLLSWFGMVWLGNPLILGVKVLYDETDNNGCVASGTAALRFASQELANEYVNIINGLEVYYEQYESIECRNRDEMHTNHPKPRVSWFQTIIEVQSARETRQLPWSTRFPLSDPPIRHRSKNKQEAIAWQCHIPSYDFDLWFPDSRWLVNPDSGHKLWELRKHNNAFPSYLRWPDISFWDAVGHYEGRSNARGLWPRSQTRAGGVWSNRAEYDAAWNDSCYFDPADSVNRRTSHYTADRSRSSRGGRASSPRHSSRHRDGDRYGS